MIALLIIDIIRLCIISSRLSKTENHIERLMTVAALCENQVNLKIDRRNVSIRIQNNGNVYIYSTFKTIRSVYKSNEFSHGPSHKRRQTSLNVYCKYRQTGRNALCAILRKNFTFQILSKMNCNEWHLREKIYQIKIEKIGVALSIYKNSFYFFCHLFKLIYINCLVCCR